MSQNNILHRDLKLGNILIKFTDEKKTNFIPKLSDYGFSKELNNYNYATCTHLGTPATMAPEIMKNQPYNEKSDLWSVGIMMYQCYYREVPYEGNNENDILSKINSNIPYKQPEDAQFRDLINKFPQARHSWKDYFNHPFFVGVENEQEMSYEFNNFKISSSSSCNNPNLGKSFTFGGFDNAIKSASNNFGYSFSTDIFSDNHNIYGEKKSSKTLFNVNDYMDKKDDFLSKIELLQRGNGINDKEYQIIVEACIETQDKNPLPISVMCMDKIKNQLKGEWFVFVISEEESNYDFFLSYTYEDCFLTFKYGNNIFQICRLE